MSRDYSRRPANWRNDPRAHGATPARTHRRVPLLPRTRRRGVRQARRARPTRAHQVAVPPGAGYRLDERTQTVMRPASEAGIDRRLIRCRCGHSIDGHQPPRTPDEAMLLPEPSKAFSSPPCVRCGCRQFAARVAPWRVAPRRPYACDMWAVWSPSGGAYPVFTSHDRVTALTVANALGVVARMAERLGRPTSLDVLLGQVRAGLLTEDQARGRLDTLAAGRRRLSAVPTKGGE